MDTNSNNVEPSLSQRQHENTRDTQNYDKLDFPKTDSNWHVSSLREYWFKLSFFYVGLMRFVILYLVQNENKIGFLFIYFEIQKPLDFASTDAHRLALIEA